MPAMIPTNRLTGDFVFESYIYNRLEERQNASGIIRRKGRYEETDQRYMAFVQKISLAQFNHWPNLRIKIATLATNEVHTAYVFSIH